MPVNISLFLTASLILLLTPGPAVLYIIARSVDQGRTAGLVSVLGLTIGTFFHVIAAALGLSALLLSSALAFNVVKYLGAAYLIYLGVKRLVTKEEPQLLEVEPKGSLQRAFTQGIVVNILNPKTALFFFAFLPQFVDSAAGSVTGQILILGLMFVTLAIFTDGSYAVFAGTLGGWLKGNQQFLRFQRYFAGVVYIGLGLSTAFAGSNRKL